MEKIHADANLPEDYSDIFALAMLALPAAALEVPMQLPSPDGKLADQTKPVEVLILPTQSNMLGFGSAGKFLEEGENGGKYGNVKSFDARPYLRRCSLRRQS
jgi:hypothetical protein